MSTLITSIVRSARQHLIELTPNFWADEELVDYINRGVNDLWRDIVDLKQEHFLTINNTDVSLPNGSSTLLGVPNDVHKVYMVEPRNLQTAPGMTFTPLDYNDRKFKTMRSASGQDPTNGVEIFYSIRQQGAPVGAPIIDVAPTLTSSLLLSFCYVPTLATLISTSSLPIPGQADNAIIAWTVAYARAKERDDRAPDPTWLSLYATEKAHLLESLGLRQYQEPTYVNAMWEQYWQ